jgi:intracellular sulfur oxidation DsrE/DsrF family protein
VLDDPDPVNDRVTLVCQNTLNKIGRSASDPLTVLPEGAVLALARMQGEGWAYVRA